MSDYDMSIHSNPDAMAWAKFYKETFPDADLDLMHGWFANAMMAMHDSICDERDELRAEVERLKAIKISQLVKIAVYQLTDCHDFMANGKHLSELVQELYVKEAMG